MLRSHLYYLKISNKQRQPDNRGRWGAAPPISQEEEEKSHNIILDKH